MYSGWQVDFSDDLMPALVCVPLLASDCPWKVSLEVQQWFSHNGLCYIYFLVKQKDQLTTSLLTSLGISGGAARAWRDIGEPQVHFVIYSVLSTSFWDSTWRQLGARCVMVMSIRIMTLGQTRCLSLKYPVSEVSGLWQQPAVGL